MNPLLRKTALTKSTKISRINSINIMKNIIIFTSTCLLIGATNAATITVDHNVTNLPPSGYLQADLDGDGIADINLASNFYVSVWDQDTQFSTPYALIGDAIGPDRAWQRGNTWLDLYGSIQNYVQDGYLYLGVRNTSVGNYYGYIKYNYDSKSNSISLNSFTYEDTGIPITVSASSVPEPATSWLFGLGLIGLIGMGSRKAAYR